MKTGNHIDTPKDGVCRPAESAKANRFSECHLLWGVRHDARADLIAPFIILRIQIDVTMRTLRLSSSSAIADTDKKHDLQGTHLTFYSARKA